MGEVEGEWGDGGGWTSGAKVYEDSRSGFEDDIIC